MTDEPRRTLRATVAIAIAARNYLDAESLCDAVVLHTRDFSRSELLDVLADVAGLLSLCLEDTAELLTLKANLTEGRLEP